MKYNVTKKAVNAEYTNKICIGYCNIQWLLQYETPYGYTCGGDGWHADIYHINMDTAIITGYQPFGNIKVPYELQKEFDNKARSIVCDYNLKYEEQKERVTALLYEFVAAAVKE